MQYIFCPNCGAFLRQSRAFAAQECPGCKMWHFHNSKPCAGALVLRGDRVLLAKRGIEPFRGCWDIPGGFLEAGEHPEAGAMRELLEETGLNIRLTGLLGIYMDRYGQESHFTLNIYYTAQAPTGEPRATDDVAALEWFPLNALPRLAFEHQVRVMQDLQRVVATALHPN